MSRLRRWSPLRSLRSAALLCALVAGAVYANAPANDFAYDDVPIVQDNEALHDPGRLGELLTHPYWWSTDSSGWELGLWRPVTSGALALEWAVFDGDPAGMHLVNVVVHAGVTALVVAVLAGLIPLAGAFLGGLVFAVHPVHVEAVANIVGLAELLSAAFFLGACLLFLRRRVRLGPGAIAGIALLYVLAFLSKEGAATLPAALFLLDAYHDDVRVRDALDYLRRRWHLYGALAIGGGLVLLGRIQVLGRLADPFPPYGAEVLEEIPRIWTVASTWPHYVRLLFFPADLSADYSPRVIEVAFGWTPEALVGLFTGLAFLVLALLTWRREELAGEPARALSAGVVWFGVTILPVSNLLFLSGVLLAERTLYLPSVGFSLATGWALARLLRRRRTAAVALTTAVVVLMGGRTWTRTPVWESTAVLFEDLVERHPEAGRGQWMLADVYRQRGRPAESLRAYRLAAGNMGDDHRLFVEAIRMLLESGRHEAAERLATFVWRRDFDRPAGPSLVAMARARTGRWEGALEAATAALALSPSSAEMHHLRATALSRLGRVDAAVAARRRTILAGEGHRWQQWSWLAHLHAETGDTIRGLAALDSARLRAPPPRAICQIDSIAAAWRGDGGVEKCDSFAESKTDPGVRSSSAGSTTPP